VKSASTFLALSDFTDFAASDTTFASSADTFSLPFLRQLSFCRCELANSESGPLPHFLSPATLLSLRALAVNTSFDAQARNPVAEPFLELATQLDVFSGESWCDKRRSQSATAGVPSLWDLDGSEDAVELLGAQHLRCDRAPSESGSAINPEDRRELGIILRIFEGGELESLATLYLPGEFKTVMDRSEETLDRLRVVCWERGDKSSTRIVVPSTGTRSYRLRSGGLAGRPRR
jgi:hypothetical protein